MNTYKQECDEVLLSRTQRGEGTIFEADSGMTTKEIYDELKKLQENINDN